MPGYLSTTKEYNHKQYGVATDSSGNNYTKVWYNLHSKVTVDENGTVKYTITSTSNVGDLWGWTSGCKVSCWISIAGEAVLDAAYYSTNGEFPKKPGSSISGTLSKKVTTKTVSVKSKIIPGSNYSNHTSAWDDSLTTSTITRTAWTDVTATDPTITDNGDNTVTIIAKKGTAGTNNALESTSLWYKVGGTTSVTKDFGTDASYSVTKSISGDAGADVVRVLAKVTAHGKHNDTSSNQKGLDVKHYVAPIAQPKPTINYSKSRLTNRENWQFRWSAATKANGSSPIKGYRVIIKQKQKGSTSAVTIPFVNAAGNVESSVGDNNWHYWDSPASGSTLTINPKNVGFKPGDTVQFGVKPYTQNGKGTKIFKSDYTYSDILTVQNAGIVHVKVNGEWKEGQVYVKVNGAWKEAESVHTRVNGAWKESQ